MVALPFNGTNTNYLNFHRFNGSIDNVIALPNVVVSNLKKNIFCHKQIFYVSKVQCLLYAVSI